METKGYTLGVLEAASAAKEGILKRDHRLLSRLFLVLALSALPGPAGAQELYNFTVGAMGGLGGSVDADPGDSLTNTGFQLNLTMVTEPSTHVGFRLGNLALDDDELFGSLSDAELSYATIGGEYRFREPYYQSGLFVGLGGYRLEGTAFDGSDESDTALGLSIGATGEFPLTRWLGVLVELSGHYADFDEAQFFVMGHAGFAVHF